jgi:hypothetical protein
VDQLNAVRDIVWSGTLDVAASSSAGAVVPGHKRIVDEVEGTRVKSPKLLIDVGGRDAKSYKAKVIPYMLLWMSADLSNYESTDRYIDHDAVSAEVSYMARLVKSDFAIW